MKLPTIIADEKLPKGGPNAEADARYPLDRTGASLAALGREAQELSVTVLDTVVRARDEDAARKATAAASQRLDTLRLDLDKDPDYANREQKFNAEAKKVQGELVGDLSPRARRAFEGRLATLYESQAHAVRANARKDENEALRVSLDQTTDTMIETAIAAPNKVARAAALGEIERSLKDAFETGVLSEAQYKAAVKGKLGKFDEVRVQRAIRFAPGEALRLLKDRSETPNLDPIRREQLATQAQARAEQQGALARMEAKATVAGVTFQLSRGVRPSQDKIDEAYRAAATLPGGQKELATAEYHFGMLQEFQTLPVPAMTARIESLRAAEGEGRATPNDTALRETFEKYQGAVVKAYLQDPGATALQRNTVVADTLAQAQREIGEAATPSAREAATERFRAGVDALAEQQRIDGVPEHRIRLMPKASAENLEANLQGAGPKVLAELERQREAYGPVLWSRVLRQLDEGKKLPMAVKVLGAMPGQLSRNPDAMTIVEALSLPDKRRDELIPDETQRKSIARSVGEGGEGVRAALSRVPGEIEAYTDYADTAKRVAEYLYGTRRASSPEAASRQAWDIVFNNHWATAGTVRIPKIDKVPVADPTMVSAYGEYFRQNLDKFYLAAPASGPATARLTEAQRLDQWKNHLKNYGAFTADRAETGVMFRDGEGIPVRGQNGQPFATSWDAIKNDKEFMAWWQRTGSPAEMRPGDPRSGAPDPAVEQMRRGKAKETPPPPYEGR